MVLFHSSKSAFSRHDNVRASSTLFIWLNENVLFSFLEKCVLPFHFAQSSVSAISNSRHDNVRASSTLFIWLNENVRVYLLR